MKVLITGNNSYIGNAFIEYVEDVYETHKCSLRESMWEYSSWSEYDPVLHVAGIAHSDVSHVTKEQQELYYVVNRDLTYKAAEKAKADGVKQFIYLSSAIVYGESAPIGKTKKISKDTEPTPSNFYGDSKLQGENRIISLQTEDFRVVVIRTPMVYGKNAKGNFPKLLKLAKIVPVFPKIENRKSVIYIKNLCEFIKLCIEKQYEGICLPQNAEIVATSELFRLIAEAEGRKVILVPGCATSLKVFSRMTGYINKLFGNLEYKTQDSLHEWNYCKYTLEQSIAEICSENTIIINERE